MDLLGSILNNMQKPPVAGVSKEKEMEKKQQEKLKRIHEMEKEKLKRFRQKVEDGVNSFIADDSRTKLEFDTMDKTLRTVVHDVVEIAGLSAFSFGTEDVDRHVVCYKKESVPSDEELAALRKGEVFDPEAAKLKRLEQEEDERERQKNPKGSKVIPNSNYQQKYEHLIGKDSGQAAAQATVPNKQFGFVPSANKRDQRSIEQTLADLKEKKKLKTESSTGQ